MVGFVLDVLEFYVEHFRKVLTEVVRSRCLDRASVYRDHCFYGCCVESAGEFLGFRFSALDHREAEEFFINSSVEIEDRLSHLISLLESSVRSVAFLPQELPSSNEGRGVLELPPNDISPLVEENGKVSVTLNPPSVGRVHDSFTGGPNGDRFGEV